MESMKKPVAPSDDKYLVFKREEFNEKAVIVRMDLDAVEDAVVIRRQDLFAAPALHSYANSIAIAARLAADDVTRKRLQHVADYFHEQAVAAEAEGYKLPGD